MKTETVLNENIQRNRLIAASISGISECCHSRLTYNVRLLLENILGVLIMATQMESHLVEDVWYVLLWARLFGEAQLGSVFAGQ